MNIFAGETFSLKWKALAIVMSAALVLGLCPMPSFAADEATTDAAVVEESVDTPTDEGIDDATDDDAAGTLQEPDEGTDPTTPEPGDGDTDPVDPEPEPVNLFEGATVTLSINKVKLQDDGTTTKPEVEKVVLKDKTVVPASAYTVKYREVENKTLKAGTAHIDIIGTGDYEGSSVTKTYEVFSMKLLYRSSTSTSSWGEWKSTVTSGYTSGTSTFKRIAIKVAKENITGDIVYSAKYSGKKAWTSDVKNGGTIGNGGKIEAIKIELTGELEDKYDVYYRINAPKIGWMDWAKNGQMAGTAGMRIPIRGYQVKLVLKDKSAPGDTTLRYAAFRGTNYEKAVDKILTIKAQNYTSKTSRLAIVSRTYNRVCVFKKSSGKWVLLKSSICSTGAKATPTKTGSFALGKTKMKYQRGKYFDTDSGNTCWYFTRITAHTLFHSQVYLHHSTTKLAYPDQLGKNVSHGCIRLPDEMCQWVYKNANMPIGTKVVIYGDLF